MTIFFKTKFYQLITKEIMIPLYTIVQIIRGVRTIFQIFMMPEIVPIAKQDKHIARKKLHIYRFYKYKFKHST